MPVVCAQQFFLPFLTSKNTKKVLPGPDGVVIYTVLLLYAVKQAP